jgi:hypothetical protein
MSGATFHFAPGTSPFHIKGNVYRSTSIFYEEHLTGGLRALCDAMDPDHAAFIRQTFLAASWYDALPICVTTLHAARLAGVPQSEMLRRRARWQAERDMLGIYKFLIKVSSPEAVAVRFGKVLLQYFDFGESEASLVKPGLCRIVARGIPEPFLGHIVPIAEGFGAAALMRAGATDVRLVPLPAKRAGHKEGVPLFELSFDIKWH